MNRLVIIGNGFDMAHGLKTSYMDFIDWYWDQRVDGFIGNTTSVSEDNLCRITIYPSTDISCWNVFAFNNSYFRDPKGNRTHSGREVIDELRKQHQESFHFEFSPFFATILNSIETKGWVDIELDYYMMLKKRLENPRCDYTIQELNDNLAFLQAKLVDYLRSIEVPHVNYALHDAIKESIKPVDISPCSKGKVSDELGFDISENIPKYSEKEKELIPKKIVLLSFNYTRTVQRYGNHNLRLNYIHGNLDNPEKIIFGYGDELDKDYKEILDMNDNTLLKNVKSVKYLESRNYRDLLEFLESASFQVFIMGHSCGNSDRTLLNTVFEHRNCVSIKPFYHVFENGNDNYLDIVQNISRNFTDMKLYRDRVVNKDQCESI